MYFDSIIKFDLEIKHENNYTTPSTVYLLLVQIQMSLTLTEKFTRLWSSDSPT